MDFGGQSFIRLAQELKSRGHQVAWVFSSSDFWDFSERTRKILSDAGIENDQNERFYLTIDLHRRDVLKSAAALEKFIRSKNYSCLVVDRLCVGAACAAAWAGIPWATVGTDGREWSFIRRHADEIPTLQPKANNADYFKINKKNICQNNIVVSNRSYWATSPYLNLTFFPRSYYENTASPDLPSHSHFLGAGQDTEKSKGGNTVLITFGNTFNEFAKLKLVKCVGAELQKKNIPSLVLTGSAQFTEKLQTELHRFRSVTIKSWMPYDEAYRNARIAVGHGGTSHVWTGMRDAVPLLVVPDVGDQVFGGKQVERLNIGRTVPLIRNSRLIHKLLKLFIRKLPEKNINSRDCARAINQLLDDPDIRESSLNIQRQMRSGGGVNAGASLLEQLVHDGQPVVSQCVSGACCC
jgi:UDP:flavonoid glycosyltransferase YjiC (YdhE family)